MLSPCGKLAIHVLIMLERRCCSPAGCHQEINKYVQFGGTIKVMRACQAARGMCETSSNPRIEYVPGRVCRKLLHAKTQAMAHVSHCCLRFPGPSCLT